MILAIKIFDFKVKVDAVLRLRVCPRTEGFIKVYFNTFSTFVRSMAKNAKIVNLPTKSAMCPLQV